MQACRKADSRSGKRKVSIGALLLSTTGSSDMICRLFKCGSVRDEVFEMENSVTQRKRSRRNMTFLTLHFRRLRTDGLPFILENMFKRCVGMITQELWQSYQFDSGGPPRCHPLCSLSLCQSCAVVHGSHELLSLVGFFQSGPILLLRKQ